MKKLLVSLLLTAAAGAFAAPEIVESPIVIGGIGLAKGRSEAEGSARKSANLDGRENVAVCNYDFTRCPDVRNSFLRYELNRDIVGMPQSFALELNPGSDTELPLALWVTDRSGELYLMRFRAGGRQWRTVTVPMMRSAAWKSGDGNGRPDLPLKFNGILLDMPGPEAKGAFLLGNVSVKSDLEPVELLGYPAIEPVFDQAGQPQLQLNLESRGKFPLDAYDYRLTVTDLYSDQNVLEHSGKLDDNGAMRSALALDVPCGQFRVELTVTRAGNPVFGYRGSFARVLPEAASADSAVRAYEYEYSPLGGVFGSLSPAGANLYGASWIRFEHPNWRDNETEPGKFDFTGMKNQMRKYIDANVRPVVLQTLYHYPKFAPISDPNLFSLGYGRYFKACAAALDGVTRYFELGNEDNGHTKFLYTEIARHAASAIRSAQPFAVLANSGTAHIDYNWLEFQRSRGLLEVLDALCVHPYTNNSTPSQEVGPERGRIYEKLTQLHDLVDETGGMKQLWSTEYGWPNSSHPGGEHDRADLYVREMLVGDMAGLDINGLYTWDRDYGIVNRPAGVAIRTYARMREGRRFAGFFREANLWVAVYEKGGEATAVAWTPDDGSFPNPIRGEQYFDLFGNPLKADEVKISQSPIYIRNAARPVLDAALRNTVKIAEARYLKNWRKHPVTGLPDFVPAPDELRRALLAWSEKTGPVSIAEQAVVARLLDCFLAAARFGGSVSAVDSSQKRIVLEECVRAANRNCEDIPAVRHLLNLAARLDAEAAVARGVDPGQADRITALAATVLEVAGRFARDGRRVQFAVFANLYGKRGERLQERLTFVPGRRAAVRARISSYADSPVRATVRPVLPDGWKAFPETREIEVGAGDTAWADFQLECPAAPEARNVLGVTIEIPGRAVRTDWFNDLEIVPAVTVQAEAVSGTLPETPLVLTIRNQESVPLAGEVMINSPDGNQELARLTLPELAPFGERKIPVMLARITAGTAKEWMLSARFRLSDGREFEVPFDVDFVHAVSAPGPLRIDAKLDEWTGALPLKLNRAEYTRGSYGDGWTPEDCSAVSRLMWDRDNLYFSAAVTDQTFNQQFTGDSTWQQDSIQIIFAPETDAKLFEINLALTPAGAQAWGGRPLNEARVAIEYRDGKIFYEAAIPWSVFGPEFKKAVEKREFLYGIAVNDDDAIVPRRFLERFEGSIVHGKRAEFFARVTLGGEPAAPVDDGEIFLDDFSGDTSGKAPHKWFYHRNNLPENSIRVVDAADATGGKALALVNAVGPKPNHFAICVAELNLVPGANYRLTARIRNSPGNLGGTIGICADKWGNKSQKYATLPASSDWREIAMPFQAPLNGTCNLIIRNTAKLDNLQIDWIRIAAE